MSVMEFLKEQIYLRLLPHKLKPQLVVANITYRCNLKCKTCLVWKNTKKELSTEDWKKIFDDLYDNNFKSVLFQGGEVFLRRDWYELTKYAKDIGYRVSLTTNGTLLHLYKEKLRVFDHITISLDSLKKHDQIRGVRGIFQKVINNINLLKEIDVPFSINSVIAPYNYKEIPDLVRFAEKKGAVGLNLILVSPSSFAFGEEKLSNDLINFDFNELGKIYKSAIKHPLVVNSSKYYDLYIKRIVTPVKARCISPYISINVEPDGEVRPCCGTLPSVGNLAEDTFSRIWNSELYRGVRIKALKGDHPICQRCVSYDIGVPPPLSEYFLKIIKKLLARSG